MTGILLQAIVYSLRALLAYLIQHEIFSFAKEKLKDYEHVLRS